MLRVVKVAKRSILEKLLQLFLHDISYYFPIEFDSNTGKYEYGSLDKYFNNDNNIAYFIFEEDFIKGFILLDIKEEHVLQEMFVLNNYKGNKVGERAVVELFNKHKGSWIIKSLPCSKPADKFWKKIMDIYFKDNYNVEYIGNYNRAVFRFNNASIKKI